MSKSVDRQDKASDGWLGASALMERLNQVRKRKRAFGGQTVDMEAVRRRISAQRRRKRGR